MTYHQLALIYDQLMMDAPYEEWVEWVRRKTLKYGNKGNKLLDLACGTGKLSVLLAEEGFDVTGVDLSSAMLAIARDKAERKKEKIDFYEQDMAELQLPEKYDLIGIFCDSLNYLLTEEDVKQTFHTVFNHLERGGLFLFDVHSIYKVNEIFIGNTFTYDEESICYIWNCFPGEWPNTVEHELTFFVEDGEGKYIRFDELHTQRTFPPELYQAWLKEAGFTMLEIMADFKDEFLARDAERIFFVARKD